MTKKYRWGQTPLTTIRVSLTQTILAMPVTWRAEQSTLSDCTRVISEAAFRLESWTSSRLTLKWIVDWQRLWNLTHINMFNLLTWMPVLPVMLRQVGGWHYGQGHPTCPTGNRGILHHWSKTRAIFHHQKVQGTSSIQPTFKGQSVPSHILQFDDGECEHQHEHNHVLQRYTSSISP